MYTLSEQSTPDLCFPNTSKPVPVGTVTVVPEAAAVPMFRVRVPTSISEVKAKVPLVPGIVIAVAVPATAAGVSVNVPEVAPGRLIADIPVSDKLAVALFNFIAVVPTYRVEFPNTVVDIVPVKLPAVKLVKFAPVTAPNKPDQVPVSTVPTEVRLELVTPEPNVVALSTEVPAIL